MDDRHPMSDWYNGHLAEHKAAPSPGEVWDAATQAARAARARTAIGLDEWRESYFSDQTRGADAALEAARAGYVSVEDAVEAVHSALCHKACRCCREAKNAIRKLGSQA